MGREPGKLLSDEYFLQSPDPIAVVGEDGRIKRVNNAFIELTGSTLKEVLSRPLLDFYSKEDKDLIIASFWEAGNSQKSVSWNSIFYPNKDKDARWYQWSIVPLLRRKLFYISGRDVSLLKQQIEQLRLSYTAMESAANGIMLINKEKTITWVNAAFCKISGYTRETILGKKPRIMSSGLYNKDFYKEMNAVIYSGLEWSGEITNKRPDGSLFILEETITPVRDEKGEISYFVVIMQDITERKKAEQLSKEHLQLLQRDIDLAGLVQTSLLPLSIPQPENYEIAAAAIPAHYVSGDLYDCHLSEDGHCFLCMADISGKGVSAAMLSSSLKTLIQASPEHYIEPAVFLSQMNKGLFNSLSNAGMFITLSAASVDTRTGEFKFANAGHTQGIIIRGCSGKNELLASTGIPLGIIQDTSFKEKTGILSPGDRFILYSDGITETQNSGEELFGEKRLIAVLNENISLAPNEIIDNILKALADFRGEAPPPDDISLIILQAKPRSISFSYPAVISSLDMMCQIVRESCIGCSSNFAYNMELAASEIFTNIINHSFCGQKGDIRANLYIDGSKAVLDVFDTGKPFKMENLPELDDTIPREGSYGIQILRRICDTLDYTPLGPDGNHWHATIKR